MANRSPKEQSNHDSWVRWIASNRMKFPNNEHPSWRTYLNEPDRTKGVEHNGSTVFPDMVVVDARDDTLVMIGEVETPSSVNDEEAKQWHQYGLLGSVFYLYVPAGYEAQARKVAGGARVAGLRTYALRADGTGEVRNV